MKILVTVTIAIFIFGCKAETNPKENRNGISNQNTASGNTNKTGTAKTNRNINKSDAGLYSRPLTDSVEYWINKLASPKPPKYETGTTIFRTGEGILIDLSDRFSSSFVHPDVINAKVKLVNMGTKIYPVLVKHIDDKRYSYSGVYAAWVNHTVGEVIMSEIIPVGIEYISARGYTSGKLSIRKTPSGEERPPTFHMYIHDRDIKKWAEYASSKSKNALMKEYIDWCIAIEIKRGFIGQEQRKRVLNEYYEKAKTL